MKKLLLSTLVLTVLFVACKKDPAPPTLKVFGSMKTDPNGQYQYLNLLGYNAINKPNGFSVSEIEAGKLFSIYGEAKYENERLTQLDTGVATTGTSVKYMYKYDNNDSSKVVKVIFFTIVPVRYDSLVYDNDNRLRAIYCRNQTYGLEYPFGIYKKDTLIWDANGNITKTYSFSVLNGKEGKDTIITSYTYDDRKSFLGTPKELFLLNYERGISYLSANNVLTQSTRYVANDSVITTTNVYTYDRENDPATVKVNKRFTKAGTELHNETTDFTINYERLIIVEEE
ncbi:hypothetical protein [Chitinophaga sp. S165]|uniref:hypothetical protein n=1 Tax=Chitinophaga sp. S165 TaxID=2135462 RepID=UPI000D70B72B|nr:hypothetical protein [Chitinophaga sp. S165]PWV51469.1 hypothetical protein C7475_10378 [Chitinophaga sp. S165]